MTTTKMPTDACLDILARELAVKINDEIDLCMSGDESDWMTDIKDENISEALDKLDIPAEEDALRDEIKDVIGDRLNLQFASYKTNEQAWAENAAADMLAALQAVAPSFAPTHTNPKYDANAKLGAIVRAAIAKAVTGRP
jgi:hypothetical protein